jgi:predicted PurR-regulated permease PerM
MLIHLVTICMGLIIAFGLQQLVELFQRRRRIRRAEAAALTATAAKENHAPPPDPNP